MAKKQDAKASAAAEPVVDLGMDDLDQQPARRYR